MPRAPRVVAPDLPHHLIVRGNNRRRLFSWETDYGRFLFYLECALARTGCRAHALALMANHVHLIVTPPAADALPSLVKRVAQRYAQFRNRRRDGSGKLFEQRYVCKPILTEQQLAVTTVYCDLNPLGGVPLGDPRRMRWSTLAHHLGRPSESSIRARLWTPSGWYLALAASPAARAAAYRQWVDASLARHGHEGTGAAGAAWDGEWAGAPAPDQRFAVDGAPAPREALAVVGSDEAAGLERAGPSEELAPWGELPWADSPKCEASGAGAPSGEATHDESRTYSLRLERPNRTRAREAGACYPKESARVCLRRE